jgi:hypothetical protein
MTEMTDFQKQFFAKGTGGTLFTQKEFDDALEVAKAEIMAFAIETVKAAVVMEREACAKIAEEHGAYEGAAELIRNRIPTQRQ